MNKNLPIEISITRRQLLAEAVLIDVKKTESEFTMD